MSVAKQLQVYKPIFMQKCPLCGTTQPMMIRGLWVDGDEHRLYPDMGYSFCNCRNIFFTKWENITEEVDSLNNRKFPLKELKDYFDAVESGYKFCITMVDPYFCDWKNPHSYVGFNPRKNYILWDMDSFIDECLKIGFEVRGFKRDMDSDSKTPECYHIHLKKP